MVAGNLQERLWQAAEKLKTLSFWAKRRISSRTQTEERFFASLRMTK
jgi:hypothetical protein